MNLQQAKYQCEFQRFDEFFPNKVKMLHFLQNADKLSMQSSFTNVKSAQPPINRNYVAVILDEVALEGLDGITLPMLKYRLSQRKGQKTTYTSEFLLEVLKEFITKQKIQAYILPAPRSFLKPIIMSDHIDAEGVLHDPEGDIPDSYPFCLISEDNIMGSCSTYHDRKLLQELDEVHDEDSIVFVASQEEREKALYGANYDPLISKTISSLTFGVLERIGRAREQGQNTLGKVSLRACKISPKDLFYHRKALLKHGLVIKQVTSIKFNNCNQHSLLFHLPRFYVEYHPLHLKALHQIINFLKSKKDGVATFEEIFEGCDAVQDPKLLRSFFKKKPDFSKTINHALMMPFNEYYPESDKKLWKMKNGNPRMVKICQLKDMNMDPDDLFFDRKEEDESLLEDEDDNDLADAENVPLVFDRTKLFTAYKTIDDAGPKGLSASEYSKKLGIRKLDTRGQIKTLERKGLVQTYMKHDGRQKTAYYVAKRYEIKDPLPFIPDRHHNKEISFSRKVVLTERQLARRKLIVDFVNEHGIIVDRHRIYR